MSRELDALRDLVTCPVCGDQDLGHAQRACMKNEIARLRATIFRLKNELREIDIAIDDPESNLTKTQAECVLKMHRTITHLREYAEHTTGCDSWAWPGGMKKPHAKCDCGYDALMAEVEEGK